MTTVSYACVSVGSVELEPEHRRCPQRPFPIEDAGQVDQRRARVGLPPMKLAAKQWERSVNIKTSTQPLESFPDR
jgi:hypothetical protein